MQDSANDVSLFSVVHDIINLANLLNSNLCKTNEWTLQRQMSFNPDPTIQTQDIIFSCKTSGRNGSRHSRMDQVKFVGDSLFGPFLNTLTQITQAFLFNNCVVNFTTTQKHLGMILDSNLNFNELLSSLLTKQVKLLVSVGFPRCPS